MYYRYARSFESHDECAGQMAERLLRLLSGEAGIDAISDEEPIDVYAIEEFDLR